MLLALKVLTFGNIGLLIEIYFTSIHSALFLKNKNAYGRVSLWMMPIWGIGVLGLEQIREKIVFGGIIGSIIRSCIYVLCIYTIEFISGLSLSKILGKCPWLYTDDTGHKLHKFSIMGLIRIDYIGYWLALAITFDLLHTKIDFILGHLIKWN